MLSRIVDRAKQVRLGDPADPETDVGPVATAAQHTAIGDHIAHAQESGAILAFRGEADDRFAGPVVFDRVARDSRLFKEEVFGPVLAVTCFESEQEAVDLANDVPFGLAAGVWTKDLVRAHRVARQVQAGTVWVNTYRNTVPQSPFGGYKTSGLGRESGFAGIREYLQVKSIWVISARVTRMSEPNYRVFALRYGSNQRRRRAGEHHFPRSGRRSRRPDADGLLRLGHRRTRWPARRPNGHRARRHRLGPAHHDRPRRRPPAVCPPPPLPPSASTPPTSPTSSRPTRTGYHAGNVRDFPDAATSTSSVPKWLNEPDRDPPAARRRRGQAAGRPRRHIRR